MNCPNCGAPLTPGTAFCTTCGTKIPEAAPQPAPQPAAYAAPAGYGAQPYGAQSYGYAQPPVNTYPVSQRNIGLWLLLSMVTCGVCAIVWFIMLIRDLNTCSKQEQKTSVGMVILYTIFSCGLYLSFWHYKAGDQVNNAKEACDLPVNPNAGIIFLLVSIVSAPLALALVQNEVNMVAAKHGAPEIV